FYNDAVLRAFEIISGAEAIRPDIAGIMGAFGAALIARDRYNETKDYHTTMHSINQINSLEYTTSMTTCQGCTNHCRLTVNKFTGGRQHISGNRCERGIGKVKNADNIPNLFDYKYKKIFGYEPLTADRAFRGTVGIPRVLNFYENYPFWFTFFTKLGYRVVLSPRSTHQIYELGIESIPSESECYPAKLSHGHVEWLIRQNVDFIFYPGLFYEREEVEGATNHYNCPIVTSYSENIKNNVEAITDGKMKLRNPFMAFTSLRTVTDSLVKEFSEIPAAEVITAAKEGWKEMADVREDIKKKGEETLKWMEENGKHGIVLAGRPYHVDPEINHGIPDMICSYGVAVLTEDSVSHLGHPDRPLIVSDQWMYHSRLYAAASFVRTREDLDLIQLNSFGCGLDAVTTDQVNDILAGSDKIYTCLKIDEVNSLGSARIRVRSLLAAIRVRKQKAQKRNINSTANNRVLFTEDMRKNYTILCPQMSPIHFDILEPAFASCGYNFVVMQNDNRHAIDMGLKYVNNDACYPSLWVVGQIMDELHSGKYDLNRTAVIMSQTGGGCRATNYVGFIRRALKKAGMEQIPVVSLNLSKLEANPGFKITPEMLERAALGAILGDIFMRCVYRMRPYEKVKGSVDACHEKWLKEAIKCVSAKHLNLIRFNKLCREIIEDFDKIELTDVVKPRVGVVGEILVKFAPAANNYLVKLLESEGAEAVVPDLMDFMLYCFYNQIYKAKELGTSKKTAAFCRMGIWLIERLRSSATKAFEKSVHFDPPTSIYKLVEYAKPIVSIGNQTGEGWFLTGEMVELIKDGATNIVCTQPFGCLPNHVVGKGVIKQMRHMYPGCNIVAIDYDPGASEVNQLNRIKLMLSTAQKKVQQKNEPMKEAI
nr:acyl-CoA dehydratase activase-related protein [Butyrivibrio sp.]